MTQGEADLGVRRIRRLRRAPIQEYHARHVEVFQAHHQQLGGLKDLDGKWSL
jgi:hypothetical protein